MMRMLYKPWQTLLNPRPTHSALDRLAFEYLSLETSALPRACMTSETLRRMLVNTSFFQKPIDVHGQLPDCASQTRTKSPPLITLVAMIPRLSTAASGSSRYTKQSFVRNKTGSRSPPCAIPSVHAVGPETRALTCIHNLDTPRWT